MEIIRCVRPIRQPIARLVGPPVATFQSGRTVPTILRRNPSQVIRNCDQGRNPNPHGVIKDNSFIGVTGMPQPDGSQKAVEIHIFPEPMRGTGEGHRPWDLQPGSTMTNATVAQMVKAYASGQTKKALQLHQKFFSLFKDLFIETNPIPVKAALAMMGQIEEAYRLPLLPMTEGAKAQLRKTITSLGLVK